MIARVATLSLCALALAAPAWAKTTVCPGPDKVDGNDVSYWQGTINWPGVKAAGRKFVIMRAAHALAIDTKFDFNWKSCHEQGLHCGVYQYFEPNVDPIKQADVMLAKMGKLGPGDLPPVIDVESTGGGMAPAAIAAAVGKWIDYVEAKVGRKPMIYSGGYFWEDNVKSTAFGDYPLWHPQYCTNCCPNIANPWKKWYFWQYSSTGKVGGITGNVDMNWWNGSLAALSAWAIQGGQPGCALKCEGATLVKPDCSKVDCAKAESGCVVDDLGGRCVSKYCPAKGDHQVCVPSTNNALIGTCKNGALSTGDCSKYGAFCSTAAAAQAKCVSAFCASSPTEKPVAKDVCLPDGKRYACNAAGDIAEKLCPKDTVCKMQGSAAVCAPVTCDPHCEGNALVAGDCKKTDCAGLPDPAKGTCVDDSEGARCVSAYCPAKGSATACTKDGDATVACSNGSAVVKLCLAGEQVCAAKAPGGPACADKVCVPLPNLPPIAATTCLPGNTLLTCSPAGFATLQSCAAGQACAPGAQPAVCATVAPPEADGGSTADDAGADAGTAPDSAAPDASAGDATGSDLSTDLDATQPDDLAATDAATDAGTVPFDAASGAETTGTAPANDAGSARVPDAGTGAGGGDAPGVSADGAIGAAQVGQGQVLQESGPCSAQPLGRPGAGLLVLLTGALVAGRRRRLNEGGDRSDR